MKKISLSDMTTDELIDLVQYANDLIGHTGFYPVEYIVYRGKYRDDEYKLTRTDLESVMQRMGYPALQRMMD